MCQIISRMSWKKKGILFAFLMMGSIIISENAFSRSHWNRDYMQLSYNNADTSLVLRFEFFDYAFGPANEDGYLEYCDFYYSVDGNDYIHLMRSETGDQNFSWYDWSWLYMKNKLAGTKLQFNDCFSPPAGMMWADSISEQLVKVYNTSTDYAWLTMKWFLTPSYQKIQYIRIIGKWHVNGVWPNEYFNEIYQTYIPSNKPLNSEEQTDSLPKRKSLPGIDRPVNAAKQVYKDADAIVATGFNLGENIDVYTATGALIQSFVTNKDIVKIKLPANQIYILKIGQMRYKVAL